VLFVTAALMTHGDAAMGISASLLALAIKQPSLGLALMQTRGHNLDQPTPAWRGWFNFD